MRKPSSKEWIGIAIAVIFIGGAYFALKQVGHYSETGYVSKYKYQSTQLLELFLIEKEKCNAKNKKTDADACHKWVDAVFDKQIQPRDLIAQETTALATRGLLWTGAWQALFSFGALALLALTVYQTGRMVRHSQNASDLSLIHI